jgi:hypothetical protein
VRAKDKSGNPIIMIINPDSVSELVTNRSVSSAGTFITPSGDKFGSNLIGLEVYDNLWTPPAQGDLFGVGGVECTNLSGLLLERSCPWP